MACCLVVLVTSRWQRVVISADLLVKENGEVSKARISYFIFRILVRWQY